MTRPTHFRATQPMDTNRTLDVERLTMSDDPHLRSLAFPITIREMGIDDLAVVFHLGERLFTAEKWPNLYRSWDVYDVLSLFVSDGDFCLVAELEDRIIGFALGSYRAPAF